MPTIKVELLSSGAVLPKRAHPSDAGFDLSSTIDVAIKPGEYAPIKTGLVLELPKGYEAQIRPRSGLAYKFGVSMLNGIGTIDANYRGEINVLLINHGKEVFKVTKGMRVAQMVISKLTPCSFKQVTRIQKDTDRGTGGFGSTGTH